MTMLCCHEFSLQQCNAIFGDKKKRKFYVIAKRRPEIRMVTSPTGTQTKQSSLMLSSSQSSALMIGYQHPLQKTTKQISPHPTQKKEKKPNQNNLLKLKDIIQFTFV